MGNRQGNCVKILFPSVSWTLADDHTEIISALWDHHVTQKRLVSQCAMLISKWESERTVSSFLVPSISSFFVDLPFFDFSIYNAVLNLKRFFSDSLTFRKFQHNKTLVNLVATPTSQNIYSLIVIFIDQLVKSQCCYLDSIQLQLQVNVVFTRVLNVVVV